MFSIQGPHVSILAGELGLASTIHFSISLPYLNENDKVGVDYCHVWLHQYSNHLEADLLEQEPLDSKPTTLPFRHQAFSTWWKKYVLLIIFYALKTFETDKFFF